MKFYGPIQFEPRLVMQHNSVILFFPTGHYRAFPLDGGIKGAKYRGQRPIAAFYTEPSNQAELEMACKSIQQCLHPTNRTIAILLPGDIIKVDSHDWTDSFYTTWSITTDKVLMPVLSFTQTIYKDGLGEVKPAYYYPDGLIIGYIL